MNEYRDTLSSLLRFCKDFADELNLRGFDLQVLNLDAAGEPGTWPSSDVIGFGEFNFELDDGTIKVEAAIGVSTLGDDNNFRLDDIMNLLVNKLIPGSRIKLYNGSTGATRGLLVVRNGTQVLPPIKTETRPIRPIMVSLLSDQTLRP